MLVDAVSDAVNCSVDPDRRRATCVPASGSAPVGFSADVDVSVQALSSGTVTLEAATPVPVVGDPDESNNVTQAEAEAIVAADLAVSLDQPAGPFVPGEPFVVTAQVREQRACGCGFGDGAGDPGGRRGDV